MGFWGWRSKTKRQVLPGGNGTDVVGEHFYQDGILRLAGGKSKFGADLDVIAQLVREPTNPYDQNAIRVEVDGVPVGHLPRPDAVRYQRVMARLADLDRPALCRATIVGGWKDGHSEGDFGVRIDLADPETLLRELG